MIPLLLIVAAGVLVWWLAQRSIRAQKPTRPPSVAVRRTQNAALRSLLNRP